MRVESNLRNERKGKYVSGDVHEALKEAKKVWGGIYKQ
jgi:hypothetical protein